MATVLARRSGRRSNGPSSLVPNGFAEPMRLDAEPRLRKGRSPQIITGQARREGQGWVCKETIDKHGYADAKAGGDLWKNLLRARRKRRRRCPRVEGRGGGKMPNQRLVDTRPTEVETRAVVGHWEGDLINGAAQTGNLVTAVERNTRFTLVGRTNSCLSAFERAMAASECRPAEGIAS